MRLKWAGLLAVACLSALLAWASAWAGAPTDQLKSALDRVIRTLEDPALKGEAKAVERRAALRKIADEIFDWGEISRRALARHWQPLTEKQRDEFVQLFGALLERSYTSKIEQYGGEKILYPGERLDGEHATVMTRIVTKTGTEVPVDYRLLRRGERWRAYDVNIEGVSLVANYRTQFDKIIQRSSYADLVEKIRTKQEILSPDGTAARQARPSP